jgi:hypothetical protein
MKYLVSLFLFFNVFTIQAQKVTGYWYGQANVEMSGIQNNYLTELIISQKGNKVKGFFGYYFKDVYQSFVVKGSFDRKPVRSSSMISPLFISKPIPQRTAWIASRVFMGPCGCRK